MRWFFFLLIFISACKKQKNEIEAQVITLEQTVSGTFLNRPVNIYRLKIQEPARPTRFVEVRVSSPVFPAKGALILTTGGFGNSFYGTNQEKNFTINFSVNRGLEVYEIKWEGEFGWGTGYEGTGYPGAVKAYTDIVKWLKENKIAATGKIICHGGSGGSFQIAYGLTHFDLDQHIQFSILVGGPPTSDLNLAIYGNSGQFGVWPDGLGGFAITDYILGYRNNGNYAVNRNIAPPQDVIKALSRSSLVSTTEPRKFQYSSKVFFVNTKDVTKADEQGRLYFDAITSEKEWFYLPAETSHDVGGIPAGAEMIRNIIAQLTP
jgi:hypothetical protein